ncbi:MAG: hypothetical protein KJ558_08780 [Gammaproteobacteria bacterium]|nr:hypothetical protein [Gammaproteobacteria bacterium]MBU1654903.1 hypothetical protein [Gammaproteobacteria bacterium]MBU1960594.1 hypothetical protein [Gammaproteobacteria bacterium]
MSDASALIEIGRWGLAPDVPEAGPLFLHDSEDLPEDLSSLNILLPSAGEARATELLGRGAGRVLFADAALGDSELVRRMVQRFGSDRIGVWLPLRRKAISWGLDRVSNADFRCLTPSLGEPGWEVTRADGTATGTDAAWWLEKMRERGAGLMLVSVDFEDDIDHNLCSALVEKQGDLLWIAPLSQPAADWGAEGWHRFGGASRFVLPPGMTLSLEQPQPEEELPA